MSNKKRIHKWQRELGKYTEYITANSTAKNELHPLEALWLDERRQCAHRWVVELWHCRHEQLFNHSHNAKHSRGVWKRVGGSAIWRTFWKRSHRRGRGGFALSTSLFLILRKKLGLFLGFRRCYLLTTLTYMYILIMEAGAFTAVLRHGCKNRLVSTWGRFMSAPGCGIGSFLYACLNRPQTRW